MNDLNKEENKKKGFLPWLFRSSAKSLKTTGSGLGNGLSKTTGLAGLFSSKAGIIGVLLGGATLAAGIGVVYNFIEPSKKVYTPDIFQNAYYQERAKQASVERSNERNMSSDAPSTIDMFKEQAQKEGLGMEGAKNEEAKAEGENTEGADNSSNAPDVANPEGGAGANNNGKLSSSLGFNGNSGGAKTAKLQTSGGMFGGIGKPFAPVSKALNQGSSGKTSGMSGALASKIKNSPKYTVPNIKRKGAFGQAKFSGNLGQKAAYADSDAGARTTAENAFTGETAGEGDIATPIGGSGLGGAGMTNGGKLKASDPNLNSSEYTPPTPVDKEVDSPWKKLEDRLLTTILIAAGLVAIASLLAKSKTPWMLQAAIVAAYAAIAVALYVIYGGFQMMSQYGQKWSGIMYMMVGGALIFGAIKALSGVKDSITTNKLIDMQNSFWSKLLFF